MGDFKEHGVMLYLDKILYKAFIKLQADKGLGRSYAGLLPFIEGLYCLGYLSKEDYEEHLRRYSQGLAEEPKPLTKVEVEEQKKLKDLEALFSRVIEQWTSLSEKAKQSHVKKARNYETVIPNAKLVLALANGESIPKHIRYASKRDSHD